jgi:hypothetical protein
MSAPLLAIQRIEHHRKPAKILLKELWTAAALPLEFP